MKVNLGSLIRETPQILSKEDIDNLPEDEKGEIRLIHGLMYTYVCNIDRLSDKDYNEVPILRLRYGEGTTNKSTFHNDTSLFNGVKRRFCEKLEEIITSEEDLTEEDLQIAFAYSLIPIQITLDAFGKTYKEHIVKRVYKILKDEVTK